MKAFRFRLDSVLTLRASAENKAQENHARALHAVARAERDLSDARAELERLHEGLESSRARRFRRNDQIIALNAIGYQQSICERNAERLEHLKKEAQARLQDLLTAKREHEVLLRLRSKQATAHLREVERREQLAVDDLVMARFAANSREVAT
jgi:flagellar export protein FliJ